MPLVVFMWRASLQRIALHVRLAPRYPTEVIAGVTGMSGCWSAAGMPIAQGDDVFMVLPRERSARTN